MRISDWSSDVCSSDLPFAPVEQTDAAFLERIFRINVFGSFHCIRAVVPDTKARRRGKIINVTSATFHTPPPMLTAYVATKGERKRVVEGKGVSLRVDCVGVRTIKKTKIKINRE